MLSERNRTLQSSSIWGEVNVVEMDEREHTERRGEN